MEELNKETIFQLPLRGLVALAARSARRVQRVFAEWNEACGSDQHEQAVEAAISHAEAFARGSLDPVDYCDQNCRLEAAADRAAKAASDTNAFEQGNAAETAAMAARASHNAESSAQGMGPHDRMNLAEATARVAYDTVQRSILSVPSEERAAIRDAAIIDFNTLLQMNLGRFPEVGREARLA